MGGSIVFAASDQMSNGSAKRSSDHRIVPMKRSIVESFPAGRVCAHEECVTLLSIYNATDFCSLHAPPGKWVVKHVL
jgi:hypothetical protein